MAVPEKRSKKAFERDGGVCLLRFPGCQHFAECADHRANRGHGGAKSGVLDQLSNLISACGLCNGFKEAGADRKACVARGVRVDGGRTHVHTAERARETPVLYPDGKRYLLCDAGHKHPQLKEGGFQECPTPEFQF